jgi:hypothetical protein
MRPRPHDSIPAGSPRPCLDFDRRARTRYVAPPLLSQLSRDALDRRLMRRRHLRFAPIVHNDGGDGEIGMRQTNGRPVAKKRGKPIAFVVCGDDGDDRHGRRELYIGHVGYVRYEGTSGRGTCIDGQPSFSPTKRSVENFKVGRVLFGYFSEATMHSRSFHEAVFGRDGPTETVPTSFANPKSKEGGPEMQVPRTRRTVVPDY